MAELMFPNVAYRATVYKTGTGALDDNSFMKIFSYY
jgi:hypothetical protein